MQKKRLVDISILDHFIIPIPQYIYQAYDVESYVLGIEDMLNYVRSIKPEEVEEDLNE